MVAAAAEGGRWRRRCCGCWCRSWWGRRRARAPATGRAPEAGGRRRRERREREPTPPTPGRAGPQGLRGRRLLRPRGGARERPTARCPQPSGSLLRALPSAGFPPATTRAAALAATRTRAPRRTRARGLLRPVHPLSRLKGLLPREQDLVSHCAWEEAGAPRFQICCPFPSCRPESGVLSQKALGGSPRDRPPSLSTPVFKATPSLACSSPTGHPDPPWSLWKWSSLSLDLLLPFNLLAFHLFFCY